MAHQTLTIHLIAFLALLASASGVAKPLDLEVGLTVEPPAQIDLTYQIIKANDPNKKVIAGWDGDKLEYIVSVSKLPPGWLDAKQYLSGMVKDLRGLSVPQKFELRRQGSYDGDGGLRGSFVESVFTIRGTDLPQQKIVHFLTDSKTSYFAIATLMDSAAADKMLNQSVAILKTATISIEMAAPAARDNNKLIGKWLTKESGPGGQEAESRVELKSDLTFAWTVSIGGKTIMGATGVWSMKDTVLTWNYLNSSPPLPEDAKIDSDEIVSLDGKTLVLRSKRSGQIHRYDRQE